MKKEFFSRYIKSADFKTLFNELGWDFKKLERTISAKDDTFSLRAVAEKRDFYVMHCSPDAQGKIPDQHVRRTISRHFEKIKNYHLLIFTNEKNTEQRWQFVLRLPNRPPKFVETRWLEGQDVELLYQKVRGLFFDLDDEGNITIVDVINAVRGVAGQNAEKVTKKFYDGFKKEHTEFIAFIGGIKTLVDKEWYASLMLNRLMFCYFIQKKRFLDNNPDYLNDKLKEVQQTRGKGEFYSFYRDFLLVLFHQGLNAPGDKPPIIGHVPYLNGGLFDVHELEQRYTDISIPDEAFQRIFAFFDQYEWHLDNRPGRTGDEINPDVIGYIFEKYINDRADMGAYYTKEDITDYISKNCIIPFLFDETARRGGNIKPAFQLIQEDPDRYIYPSLRHGINWNYRTNEPLEASIPFPAEISAGLDTSLPNLVERRKAWNKEAPPKVGLPTEWWREVVERRQRYHDLHDKLKKGEVKDINDLISLNLDIRLFAQDVLVQCDANFLLSFFHALRHMSVLDPTCGSGAFLFAALNILEPLYEACLDRMEGFVQERPGKHKMFEEELAKANDTARHPNREYYIYKSIIVHNLYGVDIMREATEIAKLRLFLKLMSTVEADRRKPNLGLEPLPDVDFNIRAGNTLVGFATLAEAEEAIRRRDTANGQTSIVFDTDLEVLAAVKDKADKVSRAYSRFQDTQVVNDQGSDTHTKAKQELRRRLADLNESLNIYAAFLYGIDKDKKPADYQKWFASHQPFHWFAEFYGVLYDEEDKFRGFDVVIGNPPYLETSQISYRVYGMRTLDSGAVHNMCIERSLNVLNKKGCISMIVPMALVCTQRMMIMQQILEQSRTCWYANFAWRPGKLFDAVNRALTIFISNPTEKKEVYSTSYMKWTSDTRSDLFSQIHFTSYNQKREAFWVPKITGKVEASILQKILAQKNTVKALKGKSEGKIYYRTTGGLYWKVFTDIPPKFVVNGVEGSSSRETQFVLNNKEITNPLIAILGSDVFWWWYTITSNLRDLNPSDIEGFGLPESSISDERMLKLGKKYLASLQRNSTMLTRIQKQTGEIQTQSFKISLSKPIIDEIDTVLAQHYGFTEEELDFIINYDIKYRMSGGEGKEE